MAVYSPKRRRAREGYFYCDIIIGSCDFAGIAKFKKYSQKK